MLPFRRETVTFHLPTRTESWPQGASVDSVLAWFDAEIAAQPDLAVRELLLQIRPRRRWWLSVRVGRWVRCPAQYVQPGVAYEALRPALAAQLRDVLPLASVEALAIDLSAANVDLRAFQTAAS